MSDVAALIADLVRAGVDPELIGRTAAALAEREPLKLIDEQAERKRAADRERMRIKRENEKSRATSRDVEDLLSPEGSSPIPPSPKPQSSIPPSPPKGGSSPTERAIEVFSEQAFKAGLPVPRKVTADRRRKIEARLREHGEEAWAEACRKMAVSAFCRGENDRGWRADLDFLCQPKSFNGLLEGKYDDRQQQRGQSPPRRESEFARQQRECTEALERKVYGDRYEQSPSADIDLEPGNWRPH